MTFIPWRVKQNKEFSRNRAPFGLGARGWRARLNGSDHNVDEHPASPNAQGVPGETDAHTDEMTAATEPATTVGGVLREARLSAGLDIQSVAARTKIRPNVLRHIEADEHDELPALTYTLGFVKAYARTVGLDANEIGERYRRESHKGDPVPTIVDMTPLDEQRRPPRALLWWTTALLLLVLMLAWAWGAGWLAPPPPERPDAAEIAAAAPPPEAETPLVAPEPPPQPAMMPVSLTATNEVWLQVSDGASDERFFRGTLQAGQVLSLPPGKPWVLRTGRVGALEVKVGSQVLPPLGGEAEYVGSLSLKPDDLLTKHAPAGRAPAGLGG